MAKAAQRRGALGLTVRIGRAWVVALAGPIDAPAIVDKRHIQVATTFEEGAVYHAGQELPLDEARALIRDSESRFVERARVELEAFVESLAPPGLRIATAAMVAPPEKQLPPIETILKAHPMVHAAEGELYRRVFVQAAAACGARPRRIAGEALEKSAAVAVGISPARVAAHLAAMGKASGRPWAADQKQAALAAWIALAP